MSDFTLRSLECSPRPYSWNC